MGLCASHLPEPEPNVVDYAGSEPTITVISRNSTTTINLDKTVRYGIREYRDSYGYEVVFWDKRGDSTRHHADRYQEALQVKAYVDACMRLRKQWQNISLAEEVHTVEKA